MGGRLGTVHETGEGFLGHGLGDSLISWMVYSLNIEQTGMGTDILPRL